MVCRNMSEENTLVEDGVEKVGSVLSAKVEEAREHIRGHLRTRRHHRSSLTRKHALSVK